MTAETPTPTLVEQGRELAKSCGWEHGTETGRIAWEMAGHIEALHALLQQQDAEIERLKAEVEAIRMTNAYRAVERAEAAEPRLAQAVEVLRPFAKAANAVGPFDAVVIGAARTGDFHAARAFLEQEKNDADSS